MKKEMNLGVAVAVLVGLAIIIGAISYTNKKEVPVESRDILEWKIEFINGCMEEAGDESYNYCSCAYTSLVNDLGKDGLMSLGLEMYYGDNNLSKKNKTALGNAMANCIEKMVL